MKTWDNTTWCYYSAGLHNEPGRNKALSFACVMGGHWEVPGKSARRHHPVAQSKEGRIGTSGWLLQFSVGQNSVTKVLTRSVPWAGSEGKCVHILSQLLGAAGNSCHVSPSSASISHHFLLHVSYLCLCIPKLPLLSFIRRPVIGFR